MYLVYTDRKGKTTNRTVKVHRFDGMILSGYCKTRKAYRTFRIDRIKEIADPSTGEVAQDMCAFFKKLYMTSDSYSSDMIFDKYYDVLRLLKYFVYVDFHYSEEENKEVEEIIRSLDGGEDLSTEEINSIMSDIEKPSLHSFRVTVGKVIKMDNLPNNIIDILEKLAIADGNINDYEKNTLHYIKKRIKKEK